MAKIRSWKNANTDELITTILKLKNADQAKRFMRDLMTESEIIEMGSRWKAARMLSNKESYKDIIAATRLSSRTVARINKWLQSGMGGYKALIK